MANSLEKTSIYKIIYIVNIRAEKKLLHQQQKYPIEQSKSVCRREKHSRRIGAELAAQGVAFVCRDLSFGDELSHFITNASSKIPHVTVSLLEITEKPNISLHNSS